MLGIAENHGHGSVWSGPVVPRGKRSRGPARGRSDQPGGPGISRRRSDRRPGLTASEGEVERLGEQPPEPPAEGVGAAVDLGEAAEAGLERAGRRCRRG